MKKILAFGASNSKNSINKTFAAYAANQLHNAEITVADLNDYVAPLYSIDLQRARGIDENVTRFYRLIQENDAIVLSLAEHNGLHTAAFKNLWDWLSRIPMEKPMNIWGGKPMFLLSTSPSRRPMNNVLKISKQIFPHFGANIIADYYLPSFNHFFKDKQILEDKFQIAFTEQKNRFQKYLDNN
ncbi:MAG: NAD(P)H-dependent oxidoreductase [Cyanobacteria bacterium P01_H01_bin.150]